MSVTKNKTTSYHETPQDVKYKLNWVRVNRIDNLSKVEIIGGLSGRVGNTDGEVDQITENISLADIQAEFSAQEKQAGKVFLAACERALAKKNAELAGEAQDDTDVFV